MGPCQARDQFWHARYRASGSKLFGAHGPGRAPGPLAGDRIDPLLALMYDNLVHPDAHDTTGTHVRPRWAARTPAQLQPARQLIADTASRASRRGSIHTTSVA